MNLALLNYPKKSHRKIITIPEESTDLAELMGIIFGDGGINNDWQLVISLNSELDRDYAVYIVTLIEKLCNLKLAVRKRPNHNTLVIVASSMNLLDFLIKKGAIKGNKLKFGMQVPSWIMTSKEYKKAFVRGMIDTDGCIYIHKHTLKDIRNINIGLCFTSSSREIIQSIAGVLTEAHIKPHIHKNGQRIYLYGEKAVVKYLDVFGSSNPRIYNKLIEWRDARVA